MYRSSKGIVPTRSSEIQDVADQPAQPLAVPVRHVQELPGLLGVSESPVLRRPSEP
jgi:hypothetical protein